MIPNSKLLDTGIFDDDRYFDVEVECAKSSPEDLLIRITASNRGPEAAPLHLLPTIWFRNTWSWANHSAKPRLALGKNDKSGRTINVKHRAYGERYLHLQNAMAVLFTENETNTLRLYGVPGPRFCKDGINDFVVSGRTDALNPAQVGTKASPHYEFLIAPHASVCTSLRLTNRTWPQLGDPLRKQEADEFYARTTPTQPSADMQNVMRQGFSGLLWSKQFYHYVQREC